MNKNNFDIIIQTIRLNGIYRNRHLKMYSLNAVNLQIEITNLENINVDLEKLS